AAADDFEILDGAERGEDSPVRRHVGDAPAGDQVGGQPRDVRILIYDLAGAGRDQAQDALEHRGLAGAVAPEEGQDLAALDLQRHALQHVDEAVVGVDALEAQDHRRDPRYARCTSRFSRTSSGVPSAISSPNAITEIRSEIDITIRILCSMSRIV